MSKRTPVQTLLAPALLAGMLLAAPAFAEETEEVNLDLTPAGEAFVSGCSEGGHYSEEACICLVSYLIEDGVTADDLNHIDIDAYAEILNDCQSVN